MTAIQGVTKPFTLTLNGDLPPNTPLGMIKNCRINSHGEHHGSVVTGIQRRRFRLVRMGRQWNMDFVKKTLEDQYGLLPEGQWIQAMRIWFVRHAGKNPVYDLIGIADTSWSRNCFPFLWRGVPYIFDALDDNFCWLVPANAEK